MNIVKEDINGFDFLRLNGPMNDCYYAPHKRIFLAKGLSRARTV